MKSVHLCLCFLLSVLFTSASKPLEDEMLENLSLLDDFELKLLRDFVRGKGRGFVSKIPFDSLGNPQDEDDMDPNDPNVINIGQQMNMMPSLIVPSIIYPSSTSTTTRRPPAKPKKSKEKQKLTKKDFMELAQLFQQFIDNRKGSRKPTTPVTTTRTTTTTTTTKTTAPTTTRRSLSKWRSSQRGSVIQRHKIASPDHLPVITSPNEESWQGSVSQVSAPPSSTAGSDGSWQFMAPQIVDDDNKPIVPVNAFMPAATVPPTSSEPAGDSSDWEEKMRELSRQLSSLLGTIKKHKEKEGTLAKGVYEVVDAVTAPPPPKAQVIVLREGMAEQINFSQYNFVCTITLIEDEGRRIIVDTGLATDINARTIFLTKLAQVGVLPPLVNYVITTHGHADHSGNTNEFPDAIHFQGNIAHYKSKFNLSDLFEKESQQLTANVMLLKTPGHTAEDISVVVTNVENLGTVGISGDLFMREEDLQHPMMWKPLAWNEAMQEKSRRLLLCRVDYIVPGHGKMFRVTPAMREMLDCR